MKEHDYLRLDTQEYSLFPNEQEVLLNIGLKFEIENISEEQHLDIKYKLVQLKIIDTDV